MGGQLSREDVKIASGIASILPAYAIYDSYKNIPKENMVKIIGFSILAAIIIIIKKYDNNVNFLKENPIVSFVYFLLAISIGFYGYYLFTTQITTIKLIIFIYLIGFISSIINTMFDGKTYGLLMFFTPLFVFAPFQVFGTISNLLR